jgi:hypothetical protein
VKQPAVRLRRTLAAVSAVALGLLGVVTLAGPASAADIFDVDTEAELVTAIGSAGAGDTIHLTGTGFGLGADLPAIDKSLAIVGPGSDAFTIDGNGHTVFTVSGDTSQSVSISGLAIVDATGTVHSEDADLAVDDIVTSGSAGLRFLNGSLTVTDSAFSSTTDYGAWVSIVGTDSALIENSTFDDSAGPALDLSAWGDATATINAVSADGSRGFFLGLGNDAVLTADGLTATNTMDHNNGIEILGQIRSKATLTDATASDGTGNGIRIRAQDSSSVTLNNVTTTGNEDSGLDAMTNHLGSVTVNGGTSSGNDAHGFRASADGDGNDTSIALNGITAESNSAVGVSAAVAFGGSIAVAGSVLRSNAVGLELDEESYDGSLTVDRTTIEGNSALGGAGLTLLTDEDVDITISASTISDNDSLGDPAIHSRLGENSSLTVVDSTVSGNLAAQAYGAIWVSSEPDSGASFTLAYSTVTANRNSGGGASVTIENLQATITHSIVAGNLNGAAPDLDLVDGSGTIDYSLLETLDAAEQAVADAGAGNILGQPAGLDALADNGGPTLTHMPLATSPVLDAGDPAISDPPATDQRGEARIVGTIDIGAVEAPVRAPDLAATGFELSPALLGGAAALSLGLLLLAGAAWRRSARYR